MGVRVCWRALTPPTRLGQHRCSLLPATVPVDLAWNAPAECPARDAVLDEISRVLSTSSAPRVAVTARADVSSDGQGRWHAALSLGTHDAHSERTLDAESCSAIASATAVIVAVAAEGETREPEPVPAPQSGRYSPELPTSTRLRQRTSQVVVAGAGALDVGTLPPPIAPGVEATLGWAYTWSTWRIRALGSVTFFPSKNSLPLGGTQAPGEYGRFDLFGASARACGSLVQAVFDFGICLGMEIDWMTGTGATGGPAQPSQHTGAWPLALGSLLASWSFSREVAILVRGEGFYAPAPATFVVTESPKNAHIDVYTPNQMGLRGALGVELRFF